MEAFTTGQVNNILLLVGYLFIIGGLIWRHSKPKK